MQLIYILLFLNSLLKASLSSGPQNSSVAKNKGRLSRVTWLMHENEHNNLDHSMFDENESMQETKNKMHYKKRKYNVKVEHKKKEKIFRNASMSRAKEIAAPKYFHISEKPKERASIEKMHDINMKTNKKKLDKKIKLNAGTTELKAVPKGSNTRHSNSFYTHNHIKTDNHISLNKNVKDKTQKPVTKDNVMVLQTMPKRPGKQHNQKITKTYLKFTSKSQVQRQLKKVYLKKPESENSLTREEPKGQVHWKLHPNTNKGRNTLMSRKDRENMVNRMGLHFSSLANPPKQMKVKAAKVHDDDDTFVADKLAKKVRVLCWVLTHPSNHNRTCQPIKDTWGKRCNKLLFMSTEHDPEIPTVKLNVQEGRGYLWPKVKAAFRYVYDNYYDDYDWFVRADDDTYLVVENLRYLLADFDPRQPMFFGCRFKHFSPQGYMSGGASITLSNAALQRLISAFDDSDLCKVSIDDDPAIDDVNLVEPHRDYMFGGSGIVLSRAALEKLSKRIDLCKVQIDDEMDDVNLGVCLSRVGVTAMDSRDVAHKGRFLVFMPQDHVSPTKLETTKSFWYWKYVYYPTESGEGCCSDYAISFHYVSPDDMYALEYLIYRIRPFGIQHGKGPLPEILGRKMSQRKHAIYRKPRTEEDMTTEVSESPTTTSFYVYTTLPYTQYVEYDVDVATTTIDDYKQTEMTTTEVLPLKVCDKIYEKVKDATNISMQTEELRGITDETDEQNGLDPESTAVPTVHILVPENSTEKNTTYTIVTNITDYEEGNADTKQELPMEKKAKNYIPNSKVMSKVLRSVKHSHVKNT